MFLSRSTNVTGWTLGTRIIYRTPYRCTSNVVYDFRRLFSSPITGTRVDLAIAPYRFQRATPATNRGRTLSLGRCVTTLVAVPARPGSLSWRGHKTAPSLCHDTIYVRIISTHVPGARYACARAMRGGRRPGLFHIASPGHRVSANNDTRLRVESSQERQEPTRSDGEPALKNRHHHP